MITPDGMPEIVHESQKKYKCIYADPPWDSNVFWNEDFTSTYPLLKDDQLLRMGSQIRELSDPAGCHLWMWVIAGRVGFALDVMKQWGFKESHFRFWAKDWMRMGKVRNMGELLLFGERGNLPLQVKDCVNWEYTPHWRGEHSEKPDSFRQEIERASPGPRLELFCRGKPLNREKEWDIWGNDRGIKNDVTITVPFVI